MPAFGAGATKKQNVTKLGSKNDSKIEFNVIMKAVSGGFESENGSCENIRFYRLKHTSDASWTQPFPPKARFGTLRQTLSKKDSRRSATKYLPARV